MFLLAPLGFETQVGTQPAKQRIRRGQTMCPMLSVAQIDGINLRHHQYFQLESDPNGILYVEVYGV